MNRIQTFLHNGLLWNLFLAVIPVVMAYLLTVGAAHYRKREQPFPWYVWLPLGFLWLAFLPNTCYLITEWRHFLFEGLPKLTEEAGPGKIDDIGKAGLFYLMYSLAGIMCFGLAVRPIANMYRRTGRSLITPAIPFFLLISLGVYMGLAIRLNSWNIINKPAKVLAAIHRAFNQPRIFREVLVFGVLLFLLYIVLDIFLDGVNLRLQQWKLIPTDAASA